LSYSQPAADLKGCGRSGVTDDHDLIWALRSEALLHRVV